MLGYVLHRGGARVAAQRPPAVLRHDHRMLQVPTPLARPAQSPRRRIRAFVSFAFALGLAAHAPAAPAAASGDALKVSEAQVRALGIETAGLQARPSARLDGLPAQVTVPNHQVRMVSAPLAGLVEQVLVASQQSVRKGQLLARMQSPALAEQQHTYLQAVTRLELERANVERDESLFRAGVLAERALLATRAAYNVASVDLAERIQALRLAGMSDASVEQLRAGRRVGTAIDLHAPIDGVVIEQLGLVGQRVEAAAPLLRIARLEPLWLEIQVPVARLAAVAAGAAVTVPALEAEGRVIAVGRSVAAGTQTALVRAEVSRGAERLRPGQFVEVSLAAQPAGGQWEVPNAAIARVAGRTVVFVRTAAGFRAQPVRVVGEGAESSLVAADLESGAKVAVKGVAALKAAALGIGVE